MRRSFLVRSPKAMLFNARARLLAESPQNLFGLCRMPKNNLFRRLAEKKFVLCSVVVRDEKHIVDVCEDLPVDSLHTMQAVQKVHNLLQEASLPMLGYVPTTLPPDTAETVAAFLRDLPPLPATSGPEEATGDSCVAQVSWDLHELERLHALDLWQSAESGKPLKSELLMRSMVKFAHFREREAAPSKAAESRLSLLKLINKWGRTSELIRQFNKAVSACEHPTFRPIYFPQYQNNVVVLPEESTESLLSQLRQILNVAVPPVHRLLLAGAYVFSWTLNPRTLPKNTGRTEIAKLLEGTRDLFMHFATSHLRSETAVKAVKKYVDQIAGKGKLVLKGALPVEFQWSIVRTLLAVPFFLFSVGSHCGPSDKHAAFELGFGLCPYHFLNPFVQEATQAAAKQPQLEDWTRRLLIKWVGGLQINTLPEKAGEDADVFLDAHRRDLPKTWPDLFKEQKGKTYKAFPRRAAQPEILSK
ncbi:hypothetical protein Efla_005226 [Eimeria flavescens]